tara:strand:+ start:735 stop:1745 length:1011 start_codon:yes stop_codon:yes gene_type:complete
MILKSYIIEKSTELLDQYKSILMYGENEGIKDDIKIKIKERKKNAEIINLFEEEIIKDKDILFNHINNSSLFNSEKLIFLHEITDKVFSQISETLDREIKDVNIYIFSNILEKRSKLRNYFEKEKGLGVIACYEDNERTLSNYIITQLKGHEGLTQEIVNIIISNSNLNRKIIKNEITKVKNCFFKKKINKEELEELLNIKSSNSFSQVRDASFLGDKIRVNKLMGEVEIMDEDVFFYLNQINMRTNKLLEIQNINGETKDDELALDTLKPKIFWKDKPIYLLQLKKWNKRKLQSILKQIYKIELLMKSSQAKNDLIIKNLLIEICNKASNSLVKV